jgi:hypothetical protein
MLSHVILNKGIHSANEEVVPTGPMIAWDHSQEQTQASELTSRHFAWHHIYTRREGKR